MSGIYWVTDRLLPSAEDREQVGYLIITTLGSFGLVLVHVSTFLDFLPTWATRTATITGYGSLIALLTIGLTHQMTQIQAIL